MHRSTSCNTRGANTARRTLGASEGPALAREMPPGLNDEGTGAVDEGGHWSGLGSHVYWDSVLIPAHAEGGRALSL